jgi:AcrR family transcriptional regulator
MMPTRNLHMATRTIHRRNPAGTRARILEAAKLRFSMENYESVGVRDIAGDAGVDAALVNRYFGSKQELFAEVIAGVFRLDRMLPANPGLNRLGSFIARDLMSTNDGCHWSEGCDPLQLLLRSAASPTASSVVSAGFHTEFVAPLAKLLGGTDARLRAAMIVAYIIGFGTMRVAMKSPAIKPRDTRKAVAILGAAIQACVDPPPGK